MLVGRSGAPLRLGDALLWSVAWGAGAAIGVALGAWLTAVGGAGAPGAQALEVTSDFVVLPALAFGAVVASHFAFQLALAALRGRAVTRGER